MLAIKKLLIGILTLESRLIIRKYKPFIVAVTGSVGKTSTKDAIYDVLSEHFVRRSEKSMNSEIGLPLTIIGVPNAWRNLSGWFRNIAAGLRLIIAKNEYPDCLILEIGADHPGDIRKVTKWLKPDIAVITRISRTPVHVEFFKDPEQVFEEKAALAEAVKDGGTLVLFADDEKALGIADRVKGRDISVISFGLGEKAAVRGSNTKTVYEGPALHDPAGSPTGMSFDLQIDGSNVPVTVRGIVGNSYIYSLLAAAAVGKVRGISAGSISRSLSAYHAPRGRLNLLPGINDSTIIDDTYNSSPDAAVASLAALKSIETAGAKIAVMGDMMELGKYSAEEHRNIGREAADTVSQLVTVGPRSRMTASEAVASGLPAESVHVYDSASEAAAYVASVAKAGDIILVKGSQSMRMERVVAALLQEPQKAATLLVRQEKEWLAKV